MVSTQSKCGSFHRGTILQDVKIIFPADKTGSDQVLIIHKILSDEDRDLLQAVPGIKIRNTHKMYQSNPYNSAIGAMKLYHDSSGRVHRCTIEDLYCAVNNINNTLQLRASIKLIDQDRYIFSTDYKYIYDYSQRASYLEETEPEAIQGRLHFPTISETRLAEVNDHLKQMIGSCTGKSAGNKTINVKILDYQDGCYHVDVSTETESSFLSRLADKFRSAGDDTCDSGQASSQDDEALEKADQFAYPLPHGNLAKGARRRKKSRKVQEQQQKQQGSKQKSNCLSNVPSATAYFKQMTLRRSEQSCYLSSKLCKVMLLDWIEPDQLIILPQERDYSHERFMEALQALKCVQNAGRECNIKDDLYAPGEFIFFRNVFDDDLLGSWLRGVVVSLTCYNKHNLIIAQRRTDEAKRANFKLVQSLVAQGRVHRDDIIYRVRSVDYGCECRSSPINMRRVSDLEEFKSLGTWTLRCKLFGVYPFEHDDGEYTEFSLDAFTSWINQRFVEDEEGFRVLFRSYMETGTHSSFDRLALVSLFHRYDPASDDGSCSHLLHPEPLRFECLNWHMVDAGLAASSDPRDGKSSNIQLEEHVVNQLVARSLL